MESKSPIKREITSRAWAVHALLLVFGAAVLLKILYIQYGPEGDELRRRAKDTKTFRMTVIEADRGEIFSYDGRLLATNQPSYDLKMDFRALGLTDTAVFTPKNVDSLALCMSQFFGDKNKDAYVKMFNEFRKKSLTGQRVYRIAPRQVSYLELMKIREFPIFKLANPNKSGFVPEKIQKRVRPYGTIASRTIGSKVNEKEKWGIEGAFDDFLRGKDGATKMQRISGTFWMPVADDKNCAPVDGIDVVSTLDVELQDVAEKALREQLQSEGADWGTAVLMEVATGEIRAMANLSRRNNGDCVEDLNHAIYQRINPGSTFKLASLIVLLEDAGMSLEDVVDVEGGDIWVHGKHVVDSHLGYRKLTLRQVFEVSSNVGFARLVDNKYYTQKQRYVDQLIKMGVNDTLAFQLEGSKGPYIHTNAKKWDATTLTSMAYGYQLDITPLHTLCMYNAVANNGKWINPIIVKELRQYGQTLRTYKTTVVREKMASDATLAKVRECLKGVATVGTAKSLKIKELDIAVKTGTAQIPNFNKGYGAVGSMNYLATIVGYFPADNPKYTCIVAIKTFSGNGRGANYYGGSLAGPVFKAIAERVYGSSVDWLPSVGGSGVKTADLPGVKGGDAAEVRNLLNRLSIRHDGASKGLVNVSTDSTGIHMTSIAAGGMPDVRGMGLRDAVRELEKRYQVVSFAGKGRVVSQSVSPGSELRRGSRIYLELK